MNAKAAARITDAIGHARDQLDQVRAEVAGLRDEIEHEQSRPVPLPEIETRVDATISRLQNFACSLVTGGDFIHPGGPHQAGDLLVQMPVHPFAAAAVVTPDALKSWLMGRASGALETLPEPADAATRAKRITTLKTKLRAAEVREIDLCWEMADAGLAPDWRGDISPELVLGLEE